jgi:hypothetical protein
VTWPPIVVAGAVPALLLCETTASCQPAQFPLADGAAFLHALDKGDTGAAGAAYVATSGRGPPSRHS